MLLHWGKSLRSKLCRFTQRKLRISRKLIRIYLNAYQIGNWRTKEYTDGNIRVQYEDFIINFSWEKKFWSLVPLFWAQYWARQEISQSNKLSYSKNNYRLWDNTGKGRKDIPKAAIRYGYSYDTQKSNLDTEHSSTREKFSINSTILGTQLDTRAI